MFSLWKSLMASTLPLPVVKYLRPSIVYYWNAVKGGVDVMSRELSHVLPKLRFQAKSFLAVRFLLMQLRNVFRLQRVVLAHNSLMQCSTYRAFRQNWKQSVKLAGCTGFNSWLSECLLKSVLWSALNPQVCVDCVAMVWWTWALTDAGGGRQATAVTGCGANSETSKVIGGGKRIFWATFEV